VTGAPPDFLISADSHVMEEPDLWSKRLPAQFQAEAPVFPTVEVGEGFQGHEGGKDPRRRVEEMAVDGVSQEILFPTLGLSIFGIEDPQLQQACFEVYNDWLAEYCSAAPDRLFGMAAISTFDIDYAVAELSRRNEAGFVGATVWEVPPESLSFLTSHYDPLWEAAQALSMPINLHILTGSAYPMVSPRRTRIMMKMRRQLTDRARYANGLVYQASNAMGDLITSGVLERFPRLQFVIVESEASWIPFILSSYDKFARRPNEESSLTMLPSEYFLRNFHATFHNDPTLGPILPSWGADNCMWSNDFPHPNSTWPDSSKVIERDLGHLPDDARRRLVAGTVAELYNLPIPSASRPGT
jgi:predicted TIM-barrel fold metal-dependent hydrolase